MTDDGLAAIGGRGSGAGCGTTNSPPLKGLGATLDLIERIVKDDAELLDLLDHALQNPVGTHRDTDNISITDNRPDSIARALRKNLAAEQLAEVRKLLSE